MSAGLAIAAFAPSIASNGVFLVRRSNSGFEALDNNNPFVAAMNLDVAGGQVLKAGSGLSEIAKNSKHELATGFTGAEESIKTLSKTNKLVNCAGKVLSYTAEHINPIICATGAVKVLTSDDKEEAALREGLALGTMFASEAAAKRILGMPIIEKFDSKTMSIEKDGVYKLVNGKKELISKTGEYKVTTGNKLVISRKGLYKKNPFIEKQVSAFKDYCETTKILNKSLKFVPPALKGLVGFAGASIGGYAFGDFLANKIQNRNAA